MQPDIMCIGCSYSDGRHYKSCSSPKGCVNLERRFANMNDRCYGKERERRWKEYKKNPF